MYLTLGVFDDTTKPGNSALWFSCCGQENFAQDIAQLVDKFFCLFDLKRAALRFLVLDRAMCPRFHVDRVPYRLVIWENLTNCPACMITPAISYNCNTAMLLYLEVTYGITMRAQGFFIAHHS